MLDDPSIWRLMMRFVCLMLICVKGFIRMCDMTHLHT